MTEEIRRALVLNQKTPIEFSLSVRKFIYNLHNKTITKQKEDYNYVIKTLEYRIKQLKEAKRK